MHMPSQVHHHDDAWLKPSIMHWMLPLDDTMYTTLDIYMSQIYINVITVAMGDNECWYQWSSSLESLENISIPDPDSVYPG